MPPARLLPLLAAFAASLSGCATLEDRAGDRRASVTAEPSEAWREAATPADERLLDGLDARWAELARQARGPRGAGALLDPAAAQPRAVPPPGAYLCRFVSLALPPAPGRRGGFCFVGVAGDRLSLTVEAGPERLGGYLFEGRSGARLVFLGTAAAARGGRLRGYGEDPSADVAGVVERIGPFRWRLAVPSRDGRGIGLYELMPAPVQ